MTALFAACEGNYVKEEEALPGCAGLVMFEAPLFGAASADDPLFLTFREPQIIGPPFMTPREWLPAAETVLSFFLPFTEEVRKSNRGNYENASNEWLHARIEGQAFLNRYTETLKNWFAAQGIEACVPATDPRFSTLRTEHGSGGADEDVHYGSAWSERHAAYVAGLGTFGISRGLITRKGMAGRYGSILISEKLAPDDRPYSGIYDYCIRCGACIRHCPAGAISLAEGKDQRLCSAFVHASRERYRPRYGCGKCQVGVPCEARNPAELSKRR
ncbi:MAG: 4Fe-4S binding protein [Clostridia bacterium]|nr:4Fe-4S binding protein [Clostridia bacterium]